MSSLLIVLAVRFAIADRREVERMVRGQSSARDWLWRFDSLDGAPLDANKNEELGPFCMATFHVALNSSCNSPLTLPHFEQISTFSIRDERLN